MKNMNHLLILVVLALCAFGILATEVLAEPLLFGEEAGCSARSMFDALLDAKPEELLAKKREKDMFHDLVQKLIDIWFSVITMVVEFVCGMFKSMGFRC